jgi:hypothetical protein
VGVCEALCLEHLCHILPIHEDDGYEVVIDISSMRDDTDLSAAKHFSQPWEHRTETF